jgi:ABC-type lipoprotein export system ATPase subunit
VTVALALEIRDLEFGYVSGGDAWRLRVPELTLEAGERVLLTGGSGSGKSTLLHVIAGLLDPAQGRVLVAGQNVHELKGGARDEFRGRHIGMIFQTFNLLPGFTALENVMLALMFSARRASEHLGVARRLLQELGVEGEHAVPEELSVGQQQRVAVARAVACEPALVLADEPTASLDPENGAVAMDLIQRACRQHGAALLCVSHDPSLVGRFERVVPLASLVRGGAAPAGTGEGVR